MNKSLTYESEEDLQEALRVGNPAAFEALYRRYYRMVVRLVNEAGLNAMEAEDLFQEVLMVLVQKLRDPAFQLTAKLSTYLFAIARNLLWKKTGRKTEFSTGDIAVFLPDIPPEPGEHEERQRREHQLNVVVGYLETLEEDCNRLLKFSFYEKRAQAEIAGIMGYSESFVKVKKHRCLEYLRRQVKTHALFNHLQNDAL